MDILEGPQKDLAHRLLEWVQENKTLLIVILVGGIGFFGILAGVAAWKEGENKKAVLLADLARQDFENQKWDDCLVQYENLYKKAPQPFFKILALHGKGACLEGKKDYAQAAGLFERAAKEPGHLDPLVSLFEAIRSSLLAGDSGAKEKLEALLKEEKISPPLKEAVEEELLWLRLKKS